MYYYIGFESVVLVGLASAAAHHWSSMHVASSLIVEHKSGWCAPNRASMAATVDAISTTASVGLVGISVRSTTTPESSVGIGCASAVLPLTAHPLSQPRLNIRLR